MGSLQAYEWAAAYPDMVERIIPMIPARKWAAPDRDPGQSPKPARRFGSF